jgi:uncharacterized membrane protein
MKHQQVHQNVLLISLSFLCYSCYVCNYVWYFFYYFFLREESSSMNSSGFECPVCKHVDMVKKVSAIVDQEIGVESSAGDIFPVAGKHTHREAEERNALAGGVGGSKHEVINQSERRGEHKHSSDNIVAAQDLAALSRKLAFPEKTYRIDKFASRVTGVLSLVAILVTVGLYFYFGSGNFFTLLTNQKAFMIAVIITVVLLILFLLINIHRLRKRTERRAARERAFADWQQLYYCYRDDLVFIIGATEQHVHSRHMRRLIGY